MNIYIVNYGLIALKGGENWATKEVRCFEIEQRHLICSSALLNTFYSILDDTLLSPRI